MFTYVDINFSSTKFMHHSYLFEYNVGQHGPRGSRILA